MSKRKTIEEVIESFISVHGNEYDYSLIDSYKNANDKLPIICHKKDKNGIEHGIFYQSYAKHFARNHGCPKCAKNGIQYSQKEFEEKIKEVFGEKYTVNDSVYVNAHTPLKFLCKEHGEFITKPYYLFQGHGCPLCGREIVSDKAKYTQEQILEKFKEKHRNKYDYSKFEYTGYDEKATFICHKKGKNGKEHGEFYQTPHSHLNGHGCPKCNFSKLEQEIAYFLEDNNIEYEPQKTFKWLKNQKIDLFLPKYNIAIECQGQQHYTPVNFGSKKTSPEKMFSYICEKDKEKKERCEANGIKLLYFTKYENAENMESTFMKKEDLLNEITKC